MFIKRLLISLFLLFNTSAFAADSTVSALTAASALGGTELFYCVQGGADRKCTASQIATFSWISPTITTSFTATGLVGLTNLSTQTTNTIVGNATSGSASPTALSIGSCSTASSALIWTTNTGFGCNTSITANAVAVGGITGLGTGVATLLAGTSSGTVGLVGTTSPTLITPILGVATATSINKVALTAPATSATLTIADGKTLTISNSGTLSGGDAFVLSIAAAKTLTVSNTLTFTGTDSSSVAFGAGGTIGGTGYATTGQIPGTATNDAAGAGKVGEIISGARASGSPLSLSTGTAADIATLSLTAGDWDISGTIYFNVGGTTTVTEMVSGISATINSVDTTAGMWGVNIFNGLVLGARTYGISFGPAPISLAGSATYHCVAESIFGISTMSAWGACLARRVR